jgi:hypothetical protein
MQSVFFYDGQRHRRCGNPDRVAVTFAGSHVIYVCPQAFWELSRGPQKARATIIHEVEEITSRVLERCAP